MFVWTEKNFTISVSPKLWKQKPKDLSTGKMYMFISLGRFFPSFFILRVDSNYSLVLYCILQIILCFSTAPEICFPICFPLENEKLFFPVRKNAFLSAKHDHCFLCGNILRNNNWTAGICLVNMHKKGLLGPLVQLCQSWLIHFSELKCCNFVWFSLSCPQLTWLLFSAAETLLSTSFSLKLTLLIVPHRPVCVCQHLFCIPHVSLFSRFL